MMLIYFMQIKIIFLIGLCRLLFNTSYQYKIYLILSPESIVTYWYELSDNIFISRSTKAISTKLNLIVLKHRRNVYNEVSWDSKQ